MKHDVQFSRLDYAFSRFLAARTSLAKKQQQAFALLCARLSYQLSQGHSCMLINQAERVCLQASGLISADGSSPLVVENNRLYLQRYWFYENRLAQQLQSLLACPCPSQDSEPWLSRYPDLIAEQQEAIRKAVAQPFSMIIGGAGTGKTSTVVKILAILQQLAKVPLRIALAAPTGKAAARLQESIGANKNKLPCSQAIKNTIPDTVTTVHYLLGAKAYSPFFKHKAQAPLPYDLLVIDEASMLDMALMSKLVDALKVGSRLILLGDKSQLCSVESGAVLADLTASLPAQTHTLKKSHRFHPTIKALADAVNTQAADKAWQLLENGGETIGLLATNLMRTIMDGYRPYFECINADAEPAAIFNAFNTFRVLCSNRQTERGTIAINSRLEQQLASADKIRLLGQWYVGRPVMVTQNSPSFQLYNGDVGLCLQDKSSNKLAVFFLRADGSEKKISPHRMPQHETVFAMTIHKSQGSEFANCLCVLAAKMNPILTKELLYTAITRAKEKLTLLGEYPIFCQTVQQKVSRSSGLFAKLKAHTEESEP